MSTKTKRAWPVEKSARKGVFFIRGEHGVVVEVRSLDLYDEEGTEIAERYAHVIASALAKTEGRNG